MRKPPDSQNVLVRLLHPGNIVSLHLACKPADICWETDASITTELKENLGEIWLLSLKHYVNHLALSHYFLQELVFPGADPRWSLAELIHAVILMAHAHSLCSFVWGCGLNPEPDHTGGYTFQPPSPSHLTHSPAHEDGRQEVSHYFTSQVSM